MGLTLIVMAAGMGSRYGGLKQLDAFGPHGETLIEYSLYDAREAGFSKFVFVIRKDFEELFHERVLSRVEGVLDVEVVFQDLSVGIPPGFQYSHERVKPWGTGHAVLVARDRVSGSFGVINADDFYGRGAYVQLAEYLKVEGDKYCLVGYRLKNTLSDNGGVSRGVCKIDERMNLVSLEECLEIERKDKGIVSGKRDFSGDEVVSMNFWGFRSSAWRVLSEGFKEFISVHGEELKAEFYLPVVVEEAVERGDVVVDVLTTEERWCGVTYKEDVVVVRERVGELIESGVYPSKLWG